MNLYRSPIFLCVFLLCPAAAHAAKTTAVPPCEVREPGDWLARIDKEPAERGPADLGGAPAREPIEREPVERERVTPTAPAPLAVPTPLQKFSGDPLFKQAYEDVYGMLSADNECSRFYGGTFQAAYVFNELTRTLKSGRVGGSRVAGKMGGGTIQMMHAPTGLSFRLFEKAVLNTSGAFYSRYGGPRDAAVPRVGSHAPGTRGARALILLHELGHVVKKAGGGWVLEDDGEDARLSERNTKQVEEHCGTLLRALDAPPPQQQQPRPAEVAKSPTREQPARATGQQ